MYNLNIKNINYLLTNDLINKYNLTNIKKKPELKSIILHFSWNKIDTRLSSVRQKVDPESVFFPVQVKTFILFYLLFAKTAKLNIKKIKNNLKADFAFKIIFNTQKSIYNFLIHFFVENYTRITDRTKELRIPSDTLSNTFLFNTNIQGWYFFEAEYLFKSILKNFKLKNFIINISFVFKKNINVTKNFIFNCFLFWNRGLL